MGAGLSGLTAADVLTSAGLTMHVVEARQRVGGRLMTVPASTSDEGWFDLGATWHWSDQPSIGALAARLGLVAFPEPEGGDALHERAAGTPPARVHPPSGTATHLRLAGGTQALCQRLVECLPPESVSLGMKVTAVAEEGQGARVTTVAPDGTISTFESRWVVVAIPPRLALEDISFDPPLAQDLVEVMEATPTWMGEALKFVAGYESPFWRAGGLSGSAFCDEGPVEEVHDASTPDGSAVGLWGLVRLDPDYRDMEPEERVPLVLEQLARLFGAEAADPVQFLERDWSGDPYTCETEHRHTVPIAYGHPLFRQPGPAGRIYWAGTETASRGGGHMEGAVRSGHAAARLVLHAHRSGGA